MKEDPYQEMQFPNASKPARAFIVVACGLFAILFLATVVVRRWNHPLPNSLMSWVVEITVDSVILAWFYAMVNFCIWAIIFTPRAEQLLVERLKRVVVWGIALIIVAGVLLLVVHNRLVG